MATATLDELDELRARIAELEPRPVTGHVYLSTGCLHGHHDHCAAMVGTQGEKRPARCKWCEARCVCPCHHGDVESATT